MVPSLSSKKLRLLLDYDGVILRCKHTQAYQTKKSVQFMYRLIGQKGFTLSECERINKQNYPSYGHTVIMLNDMFGIPATLQQYNEFVFDERKLRQVKTSTRALEGMADAQKLIQSCRHQGIPATIFTNCHPQWIKTTAVGLARTLPIVHPCDDIGLLKPNVAAYARVEEAYPENIFLFFDDSLVNCSAATSFSPNWISVPFSEDFESSLISLYREIKARKESC